MGNFTSVCAAVRTSDERYSGTRKRPWLIINQGGADRLNREMLSLETVGSFKRGQSLYYYQSLPAEDLGELRDDQIGPGDLYVRLVNASRDLWRPELVFVWARSRERGIVPLALETDMSQGLSGARHEGTLSGPVRRVSAGGDDTPIRRLLMIVLTYDAPYAGTDDPIVLRISTPKRTVVNHEVTDTPQTDLEMNTANIYWLTVEHPFTRAELRQNGSEVCLRIMGSDKWVPKKVYVFGTDRISERPESVVSLARIIEPGPLSVDPSEGVPSVHLSVE